MSLLCYQDPITFFFFIHKEKNPKKTKHLFTAREFQRIIGYFFPLENRFNFCERLTALLISYNRENVSAIANISTDGSMNVQLLHRCDCTEFMFQMSFMSYEKKGSEVVKVLKIISQFQPAYGGASVRDLIWASLSHCI